jgi:hypothetical protein
MLNVLQAVLSVSNAAMHLWFSVFAPPEEEPFTRSRDFRL